MAVGQTIRLVRVSGQRLLDEHGSDIARDQLFDHAGVSRRGGAYDGATDRGELGDLGYDRRPAGARPLATAG
jgi:hypothetical protein